MAVDLLTEQQTGITFLDESTWRLESQPVPRNLKRESNRLRTFVNWTVPFLDPKELAKDGFYYTNTEDIVECVFCHVQIGFWEEGDVVRSNHLRLFPSCPLINGRNCGNVPISDNEEEVENAETEAYDVCGPYGLEIRPFSGPERPGKDSPSVTINNLCKYFEELGVSKLSGPVSPHFSTYESRLKTFQNWKYHDIQTPEKLAEAGFYHTSKDDQVLCFYCGGGLYKWKATDDPWVEHARYSYKCGFVILHKGKDFIHEVCSKKKVFLTSSQIKEILNNSKNSIASQISQPEEGFPEEQESVTQSQTTCADTPSKPEERKSTHVPESDDSIKLCRICYVKEREIVFLPCGHFISCTFCASSLSSCALCRKSLEAVVRVDVSAEEKESELCTICQTTQKGVVFLPCAHFISCCKCSTTQIRCSLCQKRVRLIVRAYPS